MPSASGRRVIPYYKRDQRKALTYSAALHVFLLLLAIFGLPSFMTSKPPEEPTAVTVEILPISAMSNVPRSQKQPEQQKAEETKPKPKEAPPVKTAEEEEPPPSPEPSILPKPKPPKPKPPEHKKEKPKPKQDDLAAVLKAVKETAAQKKEKEKTIEKADNSSKSKSDYYDPSKPMSLSEIDSIKNQIRQCWNLPAGGGGKDAYKLVVTLRLQLAQDGSVMKVELTSESLAQANSDSFFRAAADSARRAVQECSPLKNLPQDKYATWRDMEMTFDPKEMLF